MVHKEELEIILIACWQHFLFQHIHDRQHIEVLRGVVVVHCGFLTAAVDIQRFRDKLRMLRAQQHNRRKIKILIPQPHREAQRSDK